MNDLRYPFVVILLFALSADAGDWPQLLGPERNGRAAADEKIVSLFADDGPRVLWRTRVGEGYSGPAIAGRSLILFHRVDRDEVVECRDAETGESRWTYKYPTDYRDGFGFDNGPRAVPTIDGDRVYTYGAAGTISCLDITNGEIVWTTDTVQQFGSEKGHFGRACSPLIDRGLVILQIGGRGGAGIVALDKRTGRERWRATDHEAGYSSPNAATIAGQRRVIALTRTGLAMIDPSDGRVVFNQRHRATYDSSVNAATPIVFGDSLFVSASYGVGAAVFRLSADGMESEWANDESLSNHYATSVYHEGFLYGIHGRQDVPPRPSVRCVDAKSGRVVWSTDPIGAGAVIVADGKLVVLTEDGELMIARATEDGFNPTAQGQVLGTGIRAQPALANGLFYARDKRQLVCVDLRAD